MTATYNVLIEGQTIPVPEEIGKSDDAVRQALAPFYPDASNSIITRVEKDGVVTVNVVKRAGAKGGPLDHLSECQGGRNPTIELYEELQEFDEGLNPEQILEMENLIGHALEDGLEQHRDVLNAYGRLSGALARPSLVVPTGF